MSRKGKRIKVAHVAPLFASIPPARYGGTERVLDWLIREQVKMGFDVTLFASGDSTTPANLIPVVPRALWYEEGITVPNTYHTIELDMVAKRAAEFDIIHSHFNFLHFQSLHQIETPMLTTLHWRVDIREFQDLFRYFHDAPLVAISHSQKSFIPRANVKAVIHHGLSVDEYPFNSKGGEYIAFLGRFSPEKGVHIAIEVAKRLGMTIKIGARLPYEGPDQDYYERLVKPMMDSPVVEYLGELNHREKVELLENAKVTLVPTDWPEPFGLVTIESLCCGTPVVALPRGGTGEILKDGEVGFTASSTDGMVEAVKKIERIDRKNCRAYVEKNFSSMVMAKKYDKVYKGLLGISKFGSRTLKGAATLVRKHDGKEDI